MIWKLFPLEQSLQVPLKPNIFPLLLLDIPDTSIKEWSLSLMTSLRFWGKTSSEIGTLSDVRHKAHCLLMAQSNQQGLLLSTLLGQSNRRPFGHRPHLWTDPLHSVHHNDAPITDANRCWHFGGEIHVARGVYQIYQVLLITWNKIWRHIFSCVGKQASSCKLGKMFLRLNKAPEAKALVGRYPSNFTTAHVESNSLSREH